MNDIHHMNMAGVDLNLLVVFDALMQERNVTRAAMRIGLSQPATSSALARLRHLFDDPLLVKTPSGMQPTPKALQLSEVLRSALWQIQSAMTEPERFLPETSERVFRLGMSDYAEMVFLPKLMQQLSHQAPHLQLQVRATDRQEVLTLLDEDRIDLAIGFHPQQAAWHQKQELFKERFVCVCRQNHPSVRSPLTLETYLAASHLLVSLREDPIGRIDRNLAEQNLQRHIALSIPHFLLTGFILAQTDLLAALPERLARVWMELQPLQVLPLPIPVSGFAVSMLWHTKNQNELGHTWLRSLFGQIAAVET
ncbi:LysR family transcriptional regulator [Tumidithrix helvetica PCC 7403]|uniref:LysR family transcriptional regulator n=1 Tax=Tumidithrix helvetica TaxID=3457545 RepID=UPI003CBFEBDE